MNAWLFIIALQGMRNLQIDVYHTPPFWIFWTVIWYFRALYILRKNYILGSCTPCQTEVNSKVPIDLNTPGLYFSFLSWSLYEIYCGDHITDPKCKLVEPNILQFCITFSIGNKYDVLPFFSGFKNYLAYEKSFRGVVVWNTPLCISVCINTCISICE